MVQRYLHKPLLIDGLKFDLRIYLLITGVDPLRMYVHQKGFARLAVHKYRSPVGSNLKNMYMHLTNYAINKYHEDYESGDEDNEGHKRYTSWILDYVKENFQDDNLWDRIKDLLIKTMISVQPSLAHSYRSC